MFFDTDVLIRALKEDANPQREIDGDDNRFVSCINSMELIQEARDKRERSLIKQFLSALDFEVLPTTEADRGSGLRTRWSFPPHASIQAGCRLITLIHSIPIIQEKNNAF